MKKGIYLLLAVIMFFSSCKKKSETKNTPDPSLARVASVSQLPSGLVTTYSYDGEGRATTIGYSNGARTNITYSGDTVVESYVNDSGYVYAINTALLNVSGLASSSVLRDTFGSILSSKQYIYDDSSGMEKSEKIYNSSGTQTGNKQWSIIDNDVYYYTSTDSAFIGNNLELAYSYSFESYNTTGNLNTGMKYYGKSSMHVKKTEHKTSSISGSYYYTFQYTFDNSARISTQSAYDQNNTLKYTNTYTYQ